MWSTLVKLPCILAVSLGIHISHTPPSSPSVNERIPVTGIAERWICLLIILLKPTKGVFWIVGFAEMALILTSTYLPPSYSSSQFNPSSYLLGHATPTILAGNYNRCITHLHLTTPSTIGLILILSGSWLRWTCYRTMGAQFTYERSFRIKHKLVTTGPYSIVRHPGYLALASVYSGILFWYTARGSWLRECGVLESRPGSVFFGFFGFFTIGGLAALLTRIEKEDKDMEVMFGEQWERWAKRVPYAVIPGLY